VSRAQFHLGLLEVLMIVNLSPHPLHIYPADTADRIEPGSVRVIPPSDEHPPARLGHIVVGTGIIHDGVLIEDLAFGADTGQVNWLPEPVPGTWYVVSLVVGLAARRRTDLLVPHEYVRDLDGAIIGSRKPGRPVRTGQATTTPPATLAGSSVAAP